MNDDLINHFDFVKKSYHNLVAGQLPDYEIASSLNENPGIERVELASLGLDTVSYEFQSISTSVAYCKRLYFEFNVGMNISGNQYHSLGFSISLLKPTDSKLEGRTYFYIGDYFKYRKIAKDPKTYFFVIDLNSAKNQVLDFISNIQYLLQLDEIQKLLSTDDWIEVPQDRSMYF